ncbi:MAG TPA: hypothetical protein VK866_03020 [Acidimicrobiales bacterium]|nr:hypothetical protein [Acidimicrobiales bacterium]
MRRFGWLVMIAAVLALAAACGGDDDDGGANDGGATSDTAADAAEGADQPAPDGAWSGELEDGSTLAVRLDVAADDPAVAPFAELRDRFGVDDPVTWIVGEITVPDGTDGTGRFVTFLAEGADPLDDDPLDPDDGISNAAFACSQLDGWFAALAEATEDDVAAYNAVFTDACGGQTLQVLAPGGATTTYVMVYPGPLPDFATVRAGLATELTQ